MAKPNTIEARGEFGFRLTQERERRDWSVGEMLHFLAAAGLPLAPSVYYAYEGGSRRPTPETVERLEKVLNVTLSEAATRVGDATLVAALNRQSQAIEDLVKELRASRAAVPAAALPPMSEWDGIGATLVAVVDRVLAARLGEGAASPPASSPQRQ